jgi:regulatory protein
VKRAGRVPAAGSRIRRDRSRVFRGRHHLPADSCAPATGPVRIATIRTAGATGETRVVTLEDGRQFRIDAERAARLALEPDLVLDPSTVAALEADDAYRRAREIAARLLAVRPRSTVEVRERLRRAGVAAESAGAVVRDLIALGYLDDLEFAQAWIRGRLSARTSGLLRLTAELREKGVATPLIEQAIRDAHGEEDIAVAEERRARELAERRLRTYARLAWDAKVRRLAGLLQRRGFAAATIARVLRTVERRSHVGTTDA